ncbi:MAG: hypothetical protein GF330_13625, partial [Candidatus Eisenbacteria bacterium]|nr:hypothetical protein [Candidatus Eisenbacteria bacterium]
MDPFEDCLVKGRLKKIDVDVERVASELQTAQEELTRARACYAGGNWGETATQAYFALFRTARAAINSQGYRDTNLYGLLAGVRKLYVETDKLPAKFIDAIRDSKDIKDVIYEGGRATRRDARQVLGWALGFVKTVFGLLALPGFDADAIDATLPEPQPRAERSGRNGDGPPRGRGPQ